jgi:hypothetical protein
VPSVAPTAARSSRPALFFPLAVPWFPRKALDVMDVEDDRCQVDDAMMLGDQHFIFALFNTT